MKFIQVFFILIAIFSLACQDQEQLTSRGYPYEHHIDNGGETIQPGEYAYFDIIMTADDSILNSSIKMKDKPRIRMPFPEEINQNTPPIIDGLFLMHKGDSLSLYFPLDCMQVVPPDYEAIDKIRYDLRLVAIKTPEDYQTEMEDLMAERSIKMEATKARKDEVVALLNETIEKYKNNNLENLIKHESGLSYVIHEEGSGEIPVQGNQISVLYHGVFENGDVFDSSFNDGDPYTFQVGYGRVIDGWDIGLQLLKEGTKATLFVPSNLAYGEAGYQGIPGGTDLVFYVELTEIH